MSKTHSQEYIKEWFSSHVQGRKIRYWCSIQIIGGGDTFKEHENLFSSIIRLIIAYPFLQPNIRLEMREKLISNTKINVYMGTNECASKKW